MEQTEKISIINQVSEKYFETHKQQVPAKDMIPEFVKAGLNDNANKLRKLLRKLEEEKKLHEIIYLKPEKKKKVTYWYFHPINKKN
ncbi:MAG: hypothetical protein IKJ98_07345 [Bacteroidales bacterium]|nr:hypothetical protein [Bacteroidales bacterium]